MTVHEADEFVRQPPNDTTAEQCVLGSMLLDESVIPEVLGHLTQAERFFRPAHQIIYSTILDVFDRGEPADAVTVAAELTKRGEISRVGGAPYLHTLTAVVPTTANVGYYAGIVARKALERDAVALGNRVMVAGQIGDLDGARKLVEEWTSDQRQEPKSRRTWRPVDLAEVLDGRYQPPVPTVGARDDGIGLFYSGRVHSITSESEGGKTWVALASAARELAEGNAVVYLDFEDDEGGVIGRLLALAVEPQAIRERFAYIRPEDSVTSLGSQLDLQEVLADLRPTLTVLDGVTEAMAMHGLELKDNTDIATFGKILPRWIADQGSAVVTLDHVVKDKEGQGRYAIGGVHKLNGINGAAYILRNRTPFGIGLTGRSGILIAKDRPGQLRRHAVTSAGGLHWFADLVLTSHADEFVEINLPSPVEQEDGPFRPTVVMGKVCKVLAANPSGLSKGNVENFVGGRASIVRAALEMLVNEGYVTQTKHGARHMHTLLKPFGDDS